MVTVKSDESMARHKKMYFTNILLYNVVHLPNSYLRLIHQPFWLYICMHSYSNGKDESLL